MSQSSASQSFQQRLGLFDATMLVAGTVIGSGIFLTSADIARDVGSSGWLLVVWALAGFMTIIGALSYAELAAMMPAAGGQYVYLKEAYSPLWGFLYGWTCFLVIQTGSIAAVGVAFAKYLGVMAPSLGTENIIYTIPNVNVSLALPFMGEFFSMQDFTISAGQIVAVVVIAFLTWLNTRGVEEGKWVQNIMGVAKTAALIGMILIGIFVVSNAAVRVANTSDWWGGITATPRYTELAERLPASGPMIALMVVAGAMVGSLFSMDAWNNITFVAGEIKQPRRNLPLSLFLGTSTVIVLYMLANFAFLESLEVRNPKVAAVVAEFEGKIAAARDRGDIPAADSLQVEFQNRMAQFSTRERGIAFAQDDRVATAVVELWSPQNGAYLMAIAIMISTFGCVNGMTLMGARLYCVMARDNLFFHNVGRLNRNGVPAAGLILQGFWSIILVFTGTYNDLLDFVIFAVLVFYVLTVAGLFILRRTHPTAERPYKAFGYPVLPALYVLLCAAIMVDLLIVKPKFTWPGLLIVVSGIPVYFLWRMVAKRPASS